LGPVSDNFKLSTRYRDYSPPELDRHLYADPAEFGDAEIVLRQYYCPACAGLLSQELCRRGDQPWHDFRIDPEGLKP
jgi:acetone carboxylase gamma subunit